MKGLVLAVVLIASSVSASAQMCNSVNDHYYWFGGNSYNHVLNGYGTSLNCWSTPSTLGTVSITSGTCGFSSSTQGFTFSGWSPKLEQNFQTGSGNSGATWTLDYELDFDDPNNSSSNFIDVLVYADYQLIAYDTYDGSDPDVMCSSRSLTITSNLSNKSVIVKVQARTYHTDVLIRIRHVGLCSTTRTNGERPISGSANGELSPL